MAEHIITLITATLGTIGFALMFSLRRGMLPFAAFGGLMACLVSLVAQDFGVGLFAANLMASFVATAYCECCAIILRAPVSIFLFPSNIPLVPGGSLYYTMQACIFGNAENFRYYGMNTVNTAFGIAAGVTVASIVFYAVKRLIIKIKIKKAAAN